MREEKDPDNDHPAVYEQKRSYLLSLKDFESLFLEDSSNSPGTHKFLEIVTTLWVCSAGTMNLVLSFFVCGFCQLKTDSLINQPCF